MSEQKIPLFGRVALASKLITQDQLRLAMGEHLQRVGAGRKDANLGQIMVELGFIDAKQLEKLVAMQQQVVDKAKGRQEAQAQASARAEQEKRRADPNAVENQSLDELLRGAVEAGASDVHIHSGAPIKLRALGVYYDHGGYPLSPELAERFVMQAMNEEQKKTFAEHGEVDFCYEIPGVARFRSNAYRQLRGTDLVLRIIPPTPPTLEQLGLPATLEKFTTYHQGMVLLTGPTSCGKSSTMAALVNLINEKRKEHILTIEDPIEYAHTSKSCLVNQRSVKLHTESFARALRAALREDPDIIVIGELRDPESISLAMTAAETGHFVLATLHTDNAIRTVNRMVGAFPPDQQEQVRSMLSESLRAVISQRLLPTADEQSMVPALEIMVGNLAIGNLIRENKTVQIRSLLQTGGETGMKLLDNSLAELVKTGKVTREQALRHAEDPKLIPGG